MRVTFLATHSLESPGGGGRFFPLAKALTKCGYEVTMITLHHDFAHAEQKAFVQDGVYVRYVAQMHVHKSGNQKRYFSPVKLLWVTAVATLCLTWAALYTPADVIHICKAQPMNGLAAWVVHVLKKTPVFLDSDDYEAINNRFSGKWQQRLVAWFEDWIPSFAAGITANTTFIANRYRALGYSAAQIVLVPNGVDRARFAVLDEPDISGGIAELKESLAIPVNHQVVVYIGSMSLVSHAVDLLLEAFALVHQEWPATCLVLAGAGEDLNGLQQLAERLGIGTAVRFTGRISASEAPYYYRLGDLSVDPLRNDVAAESSLSLKLAESIASGVPCVTMDIGDRKAAVGLAGTAVLPGDVQALAEGILMILEDTHVAEQMKAATRQMRDQLWWDARAHAFTSLYPSRSVVHRTGSQSTST